MNFDFAVKAELSRAHKPILFGLVVFLAVALVGVVAPAANASSYTYAQAELTPERQSRYSGLRSTISGAEAYTILGVGTTTVQTYYGYPGYSVVGFATSNNPSTVTFYHLRKSNLYGSCFWSYYGVGGYAKITCSVKN